MLLGEDSQGHHMMNDALVCYVHYMVSFYTRWLFIWVQDLLHYCYVILPPSCRNQESCFPGKNDDVMQCYLSYRAYSMPRNSDDDSMYCIWLTGAYLTQELWWWLHVLYMTYRGISHPGIMMMTSCTVYDLQGPISPRNSDDNFMYCIWLTGAYLTQEFWWWFHVLYMTYRGLSHPGILMMISCTAYDLHGRGLSHPRIMMVMIRTVICSAGPTPIWNSDLHGKAPPMRHSFNLIDYTVDRLY
jgi:hypothetical protein